MEQIDRVFLEPRGRKKKCIILYSTAPKAATAPAPARPPRHSPGHRSVERLTSVPYPVGPFPAFTRKKKENFCSCSNPTLTFLQSKKSYGNLGIVDPLSLIFFLSVSLRRWPAYSKLNTLIAKRAYFKLGNRNRNTNLGLLRKKEQKNYLA